MENVIKIENLYKSFKDVKAVQDISFNVKRGEFFAFLGVNGAGKSTTISILCGLLKEDSGKIEICGKDVNDGDKELVKKLGVVFQNSKLDQSLTVKENLKTRASLYGIVGEEFSKRLEELSNLLNFKDYLNRTVSKLSGGQKRRIDVARALLHKPEILILDEPTTGLDPQTRKLLWATISSLREKENLTVFLTTHYMEETSNADYVVILDSGRIVAQGSPLELKNKYSKDYILLYNVKKEEVESLNCPFEVISNGYKIEIENTAVAVNLIKEHQNIFKDFEVVKGKMDDVFLNCTGKSLKEI